MKVLMMMLMCALVAAEDPTAEVPGVQDLTPETFDGVVNGKIHALVEFYAPWCGHCKKLTPEFKKLGEKILSDPKLKSRVVVAKVNADAHRALGTRFGVTGFPTLKWFARGQPVSSPETYQGSRTADGFLGFITDKLEADKGFGRIDLIDPIVESFLTGDKDEIIKLVEEKVDALEGEEQENGHVYLRLMRKTKEKGAEYLTTERERVKRIIESGSVNQDKALELSRKVSIISAFLPEQ